MLGKDDKVAWHVVNKYLKKMKMAYKRNMKILAEEENAGLGRNRHCCLIERSLCQEPKCEGNFTVTDISTTSDAESLTTSAKKFSCVMCAASI